MASDSEQTASSPPERTCPICSREVQQTQLIPARLVRPAIASHIREEYPEWTEENAICLTDLHRFRMEYIKDLVAEDDDLSDAEAEAISGLDGDELVAENVNEAMEETATFWERVSDGLATFGGSWPFIGLFLFFIVTWMVTNVTLLTNPVDPFPFILLNLVLSCLAAIQAPIILMSQNRQEDRDRLRAEQDYAVNLHAELEIRQLHDKLDYLLLRQWQRLLEIQELQSDLIDELALQDSVDRPSDGER